MFAKINHGMVAYPPRNDGNRCGVDRDPAWLTAHGYREYTPSEILAVLRRPVAEPPRRYSQLAIIRALGDRWESQRAELVAAGLLDQFFAADYLEETDPVFASVAESLSDAERGLLETKCRRE